MEDVLAPLPATQPALSQIERVVDVFIAPSKTYTDILRSTAWWLPMLLLVLSTFVSGYVVQRQVGFERSYENQVRLSPKQQEAMDAAPPEQRAARMRIGTTITKFATYGAWVFILVFFFIYSLIAWAALNFGLGAQTRYWQVFAVVIYSAMPYLIMTLLTIVTLLFGGNAEAYDYKNPVGTNLAYFMPDAAPALKAFLGALDLVKLWSLVIETLGLSIIARKTFGQAAIVTFTLWVLGVGIKVVSALFS